MGGEVLISPHGSKSVNLPSEWERTHSAALSWPYCGKGCSPFTLWKTLQVPIQGGHIRILSGAEFAMGSLSIFHCSTSSFDLFSAFTDVGQNPIVCGWTGTPRCLGSLGLRTSQAVQGRKMDGDNHGVLWPDLSTAWPPRGLGNAGRPGLTSRRPLRPAQAPV